MLARWHGTIPMDTDAASLFLNLPERLQTTLTLGHFLLSLTGLSSCSSTGFPALDEFAVASLSLEVDSELVLGQINGAMRCPSPGPRPTCTAIQKVLHYLWQQHGLCWPCGRTNFVRALPRSLNTAAASLANRAMDTRLSVAFWEFAFLGRLGHQGLGQPLCSTS